MTKERGKQYFFCVELWSERLLRKRGPKEGLGGRKDTQGGVGFVKRNGGFGAKGQGHVGVSALLKEKRFSDRNSTRGRGESHVKKKKKKKKKKRQGLKIPAVSCRIWTQLRTESCTYRSRQDSNFPTARLGDTMIKKKKGRGCAGKKKEDAVTGWRGGESSAKRMP